MKVRLGIALLLAAFGAGAQQPPTYGCDTPESKQLDFWLGDWELTHTGPGGKPLKSRNRITKTLDGCAVLEEFRWKQTWVDNTASYLDFEGATVDGDMAFVRSATRAGKVTHQRMVFRDVRADSLTWLWQSSPDDKAWTTQWEIAYRRK